jgi:hypothetical protein
MQPIQFRTNHLDDLWQYHLPSTRHCFLDEGVYEQDLDLDDEGLDLFGEVASQMGLTNQANEENSLFYAIALQKLTKGRPLAMAWFGNPKEIETHFPHAQIIRCEWLPCLEFTIDDKDCRDLGCLRPAEFLEMVEYFDKSIRNRYFYLLVISAVEIPRYIHLYGADVTNWTFLIGDKLDKAIEMLTTPKLRPSVAGLLESLDCVAKLQIGEDEGYLDYFRISAKKEMDAEIEAITLEMNRFGNEYEALLSELLPMDEEWKVESIREFLKGFVG